MKPSDFKNLFQRIYLPYKQPLALHEQNLSPFKNLRPKKIVSLFESIFRNEFD
jgi:hypothetical protein